MPSPPQTPEEQARAIRHWIPGPSWYKPLLCTLVVQLSRLVMQRLNRVSFEGREHWDPLFEGRSRGLLSFSNHVSLFDDPLLISNLGTTRYNDVRWIPADHLNFFGSWLKGVIFSAGKCVPIIRGGGLHQPGFGFLLERLSAGDWVHIFPEGGRTRDPEARLRLPFKSGLGKLLVEARPLTIPFLHQGMHQVLPIGSRLPSRGQQVRVRFGAATDINDQWVDELGSSEENPEAAWEAATHWGEEQLLALEKEVRA